MNDAQKQDEHEMSAGPVRIYINGERHETTGTLTVTALLSELQVPVERVAIELNKSIVRKRDWENTIVGEGAQVEIVEFVGGG
jgi:thiamine biosynthesis protein ThiS